MLGVRGVPGDHHTGQIHTIQQRRDLGDLVGVGGDPYLRDHDRLGVRQRGEQPDLTTLDTGPAAVADGLAVHRDRDQRARRLALPLSDDRRGHRLRTQPRADPLIGGVSIDVVRDPTHRGRTRDHVRVGHRMHTTPGQPQQLRW